MSNISFFILFLDFFLNFLLEMEILVCWDAADEDDVFFAKTFPVLVSTATTTPPPACTYNPGSCAKSVIKRLSIDSSSGHSSMDPILAVVDGGVWLLQLYVAPRTVKVKYLLTWHANHLGWTVMRMNNNIIAKHTTKQLNKQTNRLFGRRTLHKHTHSHCI